MTYSNAPKPFNMAGPDITRCYLGDEIMRRRLFNARVLYVMRVANVLRSIEAKPELLDLTTCSDSCPLRNHSNYTGLSGGGSSIRSAANDVVLLVDHTL